jgi:tryptophan synthase alpha chain
MNAIQKLFSEKNGPVLSIYFTAGFPGLNDTSIILKALSEHGADLIEIGMPYSDPLADGPVIQHSSVKALHNGMNIHLLLQQLNEIRNPFPTKKLPLILMGYLNPVLQYGFKKFCADAKAAGISGIILPDLPIIEFEKEYQKIIEENDLDFIFLITPETSEERIRKIDSLSKGFIYAVSSSSVTGSDTDMNAQENYFKRIQNMHLKNKVLIGFGIRDRRTFQQASRFTAGAIIGTAYIQAIENAESIDATTEKFLNSILQSE